MHGMVYLAQAARKRTTPLGPNWPPRGDDLLPDGPDEATALIAETTENLARLARGHKLEMLDYLLRMANLEAAERLRLRSRRKLC